MLIEKRMLRLTLGLSGAKAKLFDTLIPER